MKNSAVRFNHENQTIVITKEFAKEASNPTSNAYKELLKLKRDNREYSVVVRATSKRNSSTSKITLKNMRAYISKHDDESGSIMAKFNSMVNEETGENLKRTSFFAIKKWFFEQYGDLTA